MWWMERAMDNYSPYSILSVECEYIYKMLSMPLCWTGQLKWLFKYSICVCNYSSETSFIENKNKFLS